MQKYFKAFETGFYCWIISGIAKNAFVLIDIKEIEKRLKRFKVDDKKMFITSSFQTHSIPLLHLLSQINPTVPVYFINTGFHFPETISYKDVVAGLLGLKVINLYPNTPKNLQTDACGNLMFTFDPDYCCYLNKVQPIEALLDIYDVWINGVRADQSQHRHQLSTIEQTNNGTIRYHPLLYVTHNEIYDYIMRHNLPEHPLEARGYKSIGCEPCTRPAEKLNHRDSRWVGLNKTECGLNTEFLKKK